MFPRWPYLGALMRPFSWKPYLDAVRLWMVMMVLAFAAFIALFPATPKWVTAVVRIDQGRASVEQDRETCRTRCKPCKNGQDSPAYFASRGGCDLGVFTRETFATITLPCSERTCP